MKLYSEGKNYKLYEGNMLDMAEVIAPNSIDSIVTDPPYELNFMNKGWDNSGIAFQKSAWEKCYQVLKPGGYLLAFGGTRTYHRIACAIEDAGFEIRDTIMWIYGSGFPKSLNIGLAIDKKNGIESPVIGQNPDILKKQAKDLKEGHRSILDSFNAGAPERNNGFKAVSADIREAQNEWAGWGTQLKPAYEPIIIARKPCEGTCVDNVLKYGVGGINIDECRVPANPGEYDIRHYTNEDCFQNTKPKQSQFQVKPQPDGRYPANVILTYDDSDYEEVCGGMPLTGSGNGGEPFCYAGREYNNKDTSMFNGDKPQAPSNYNDIGSAARYFYCAKASARDRDEGLDSFESVKCSMMASNANIDSAGNFTGMLAGRDTMRKNTHPTVKPCDLMQYLVRLVTPKDGIVLDPFNGSGSTGKATIYENKDRDANYTYIGIELSSEYLEVSDARISYVLSIPTQYKLF
jgi:site-specific DNA-methyltransferase (adenine-specific)